MVRFALAPVALVALSFLVSGVSGVNIDRSTSSWKMRSLFGQTKCNFDTSLTNDKGSLLMDFFLEPGFSTGYSNPRVSALRLTFTKRAMMCDYENADPNCVSISDVENKNSGFTSNALVAGARSLLLSFTQFGVNGVSPGVCQISKLGEFCNSLSACDALGWSNPSTYQTEWAAGAASSAQNPMTSLTVTNFESTQKTGSGGNRGKMTITTGFTLQVPNDFFGTSNDWTLGLETGYDVYMTYAMWLEESSDAPCSTAAEHRGMFQPDFVFATTVPWTNDEKDTWKGSFVTTLPPTAAPTSSPTMAPTKRPTTGTPTKNPTKEPTKAPTTQMPTMAPTTGTPTKSPTKKPTQAPTTARPTKSPTPNPTKRPTTARPTKAPTTQSPTKSPEPLPCPMLNKWDECTRINSWFKGKASDWKKRRELIKGQCRKKGCYWCGYTITELNSRPGALNCRPRMGDFPSGPRPMDENVVCPADISDPFSAIGCELFPNCPLKEEMSACRQLNIDFPNMYNKRKCEQGFSIMVNGQDIRVKPKRCAYANGICRAIGDYWYGRKSITQIPGFMNIIKGCPYL